MDSLKEEFMKLKTYDEFEKNRNKFKGMKFDSATIKHLSDICGKLYVGGDIKNGIIEEVKRY